MSVGELAVVVGTVLCALAFAALAVTLVRVGDTLRRVRIDVEELRVETAASVDLLRRSAEEARDTMATARADLDRFDRLLGSAEAISDGLGRTTRVGRAALSAPVIKAAGLATGTSRAVRRLRDGA